jgi:ATPases involved in chromosome partitioning
MTSVTVFNNKGGVGKTTLLCNLAAYLALKKQRKVLIVDADPQCNATLYLFPDEKIAEIYEGKHGSIHDLLVPLSKGKGYHVGEVPLLTSTTFKLDLLPGDPKLALQEDLLATDWQQAQGGDARGLQTTMVFLELLQRVADYDFVFFDLGPSLGAINRAVLLACDYFMIPMSSDIFSLQAIENISVSLGRWKKGLQAGVNAHKDKHDEEFLVQDERVSWRLKFLGYVTQQYIAKSVRGVRQPVKAYDKIIKKIPTTIQNRLIDEYSEEPNLDFELGQIPNLHSLIPLSQSAHVPIFTLQGRHGVVGAHFVKVAESENIIAGVADHFLQNIEKMA